METVRGPVPAGGDDLLDYRSCAELLRTSKSFVERLVAERRLPYLKLGHFVRIRRSDLEAYLAESRVPAAREAK